MSIEAIWQAQTQQALFREMLEAMARPGTVRDLAHPLEGANALRGLLTTLMDGSTTLADPHGLVHDADRVLLQAALDMPERARFVAVSGERAPDFQPALGTLASPELGATLVIVVTDLSAGSLTLDLTGPGVESARRLACAGLHPDWIAAREEWNADFPLGVDLILVDKTKLVAMPRTTRINVLAEVH
ncbi:MAG: phosphonate C-P lyase system protein PhnH [Sulfuricella sp.]